MNGLLLRDLFEQMKDAVEFAARICASDDPIACGRRFFARVCRVKPSSFMLTGAVQLGESGMNLVDGADDDCVFAGHVVGRDEGRGPASRQAALEFMRRRSVEIGVVIERRRSGSAVRRSAGVRASNGRVAKPACCTCLGMTQEWTLQQDAVRNRIRKRSWTDTSARELLGSLDGEGGGTLAVFDCSAVGCDPPTEML